TAPVTTALYPLSLHDALPISGAAFPGQNADLGENQMLFPSGRSVYNGLQVSLRQNFANPIRGLKNMNLQVSYALSRFNSMTDDQDRKSTRLNSSHDQISYAVF